MAYARNQLKLVVVGHVRLSMLPPPLTSLLVTDQWAPSHCAINSPCDDHPIAMHRVLVGHDTSEMPAPVAPVKQFRPGASSTRASAMTARSPPMSATCSTMRKCAL